MTPNTDWHRTLKTQATDNHGHSYSVTLTETPNQYNKCPGDHYPRKPDWTVRIEGTPGSWYLTTLEAKPRAQIWIDYGADWLCTNLDEVMREVHLILQGVDRLTVQDVNDTDQRVWDRIAAVQ